MRYFSFGKLFLVAALLAMVATACAGSAPPAPTPTLPPPTDAAPAPTQTPPPPTDAVSLGESLAAQNNCTRCHSIDGTPRRGPTWKGLFGKEESLADGSTVQVEEAYLRESIVDPKAKIVDGFSANIMAGDYGQKLSDSDIRAIIEYIKTLN